MTRRILATGLILFAAVCAGAIAGEEKPPFKMIDVSVKGAIEGENISFTIDLAVDINLKDTRIDLVSGDLVLIEVTEPTTGHTVRYDPASRTYSIGFEGVGRRKAVVTFASRPRVVERGEWREASFTVPSSNVRKLEVLCDRSDLEVLFPGAMRLVRDEKPEGLTVTALLGPKHPFAVRWKPQVQKLEAKLVMASDANTIVTAGTGVLKVDTLYVFDISQGSMKELSFAIPAPLNVTQVRGPFIRDWRIEEPATEGAPGRLVISLTRPQSSKYALQLEAEAALAAFPVEMELPSVNPEGVIRAGGQLAIGTDSAIRLVMRDRHGMSQIDRSAFGRIVIDRESPRPLPRSNAFFYDYATSPYAVKLSLEDLKPSYDATERLVAQVREDDLTIDAEIELDIRDAPVRHITLSVPGGFVVANVVGSEVDDYTVHDGEGGIRRIEIAFKRPVIGRTLIRARLELGEGPLDRKTTVAALTVKGAKNQRGHLVISADEGVQIDQVELTKLREVHTGSLPMRVAGAKFAYRFREGDWSLSMLAREKPPSIRSESFHLVSLGDGIVYGSVAVTYFISGAPVDELRFRIPKELENVEFVSRDVRRWTVEGDIYKVHLQRKIIGDYTLLVTHNQSYAPGEKVLIGGVRCEGVDPETGYIAVASHLNLKLTALGTPSVNLLGIDREEFPSTYRLLVNAPILRSYKYVGAPHSLDVAVTPYDRGALAPAVIDMSGISTQVHVRETGETESVTRIRYSIKNSKRQFLALAMPQGTRVWSVRIIEIDKGSGKEKARRVTASRNVEKGLLMIPLERRRDPNDPVTIELEYAQTHGELGLGGAMRLQAPRGDVSSTFARWSVSVSDGWVVYPELEGNMLPEERPNDSGGIAVVLSSVLWRWNWARRRLTGSGWAVLTALLLIAGLTATFILARPHFGRAVLGAGALVLVVAGVVASQIPQPGLQSAPPGRLASSSFTQVINLDDATPLWVTARVVPVWRRHVTIFGSVIMPAIALICLVMGAMRRRMRPAAIALGVTAAVFAVAQLPAMWSTLTHIFTWGIPAALAIICAKDFARSLLKRPGAAAVAAVLLAATIASGCGGTVSKLHPPELLPDKIEYHLKAEKDSMEVDIAIFLETKGKLRIPVMPGSAVLLTPESAIKNVKVREEEGVYSIYIEEKGRYEVRLRFLVPLPEAGEDQVRSFGLNLPRALTNGVTLVIPEAGMDVAAPTAVRLTKNETAAATIAHAIFGQGDRCSFVWRPRARETRLEEASFSAEVTSLVRFDAGLSESRHRIALQISQGELREMRLLIPGGTTVTDVSGEDLGAWRFDPVTHELEVKLSKPASGRYSLDVTTQSPADGLPHEVKLSALEVLGADRQRGSVGLAATAQVFIEVTEHPPAMSLEDFVRGAAKLIGDWSSIEAGDVRHSYRHLSTGESLAVKINEVRPEIRAVEASNFIVKDDRLSYDGNVLVQVAKAGLFSARISIPEGYDIDALVAQGLSHWDDIDAADGRRNVMLYFKQKLMGSMKLQIVLSRSVAELPDTIEVPRIEIDGALKHTGQVTIRGERGVRLAVGTRKGVSELNPVELGFRGRGVMAFRLLRPNWSLSLKTETVQARTEVEFLHVARVTEGLTRHTTYLGYRLHNAGSKSFEVQVPKGALGLEIAGADIANTEETTPGSGLWRVELARKWFDRPYVLTVRYETRFDRKSGDLTVPAARAAGVELQRGHVVVHASEKVELTTVKTGPSLRSADARSIPRNFGSADHSDAVFCYTSAISNYELVLKAKRHDAAKTLAAEVRGISITSAVTEAGDALNRVRMILLVGPKRYLETRLPAGSEMWSLLVDGRARTPSIIQGAGGRGPTTLIPLEQAAEGEVEVAIEFIYASPVPQWNGSSHALVGPRFDLPLKNVTWTLYLPEGFDYDDFDGTLTMMEGAGSESPVRRYDTGTYQRELAGQRHHMKTRAEGLLAEGKVLARRGDQRKARQALESAYNLSLSEVGLNEDARVQLDSLVKQQAMVGLVGRRGNMRPQGGAGGAEALMDLGDRFSGEQAERLVNSLSKDDSENLQLIAGKMTAQQQEAAGFLWPLHISLATRGKVVRLRRSLQVEPDAEILVTFSASRLMQTPDGRNLVYTIGLFVLLVIALAVRGVIRRTMKARSAEA